MQVDRSTHHEIGEQAFRSDCGYYHLCPAGWIRSDTQPFPPDRIETWRYVMEQPAEDAKERDCLTRIWVSPSLTQQEIDALWTQHGEPIAPSHDRTITLRCDV